MNTAEKKQDFVCEDQNLENYSLAWDVYNRLYSYRIRSYRDTNIGLLVLGLIWDSVPMFFCPKIEITVAAPLSSMCCVVSIPEEPIHRVFIQLKTLEHQRRKNMHLPYVT